MRNVGPVLFLVKLNEGQIVKRHLHHLHCCLTEPEEPPCDISISSCDLSSFLIPVDVQDSQIASIPAPSSTDTTLSPDTANYPVLPI